jgi:hypothetical protein
MMQEPREAPTASAMPLVERLKLRVHELGFSLFGVTQPAPSEQLSFYRAWIENRHHGEMQYLARADSIARRADLSMTMGSGPSSRSGTNTTLRILLRSHPIRPVG